MRVRNLPVLLVPLLVAGAAACGDDGGGDPETFCAEARPALDLLDQWAREGDPADPALSTAAEAMEAVADPPSEVAEEWDAAVESITALDQVDRGDPEAVADANSGVVRALDDLDVVQDYLGRSC